MRLGRRPLANIDSLYAKRCCFAVPPQQDSAACAEDQDRQHYPSPGSCGCLPRNRLPSGRLAVTTVGLSPTSRRQLSGHTSDWLGSNLPLLKLLQCRQPFGMVPANRIYGRLVKDKLIPFQCMFVNGRLICAAILHHSCQKAQLSG